jgi:hypothetical protein
MLNSVRVSLGQVGRPFNKAIQHLQTAHKVNGHGLAIFAHSLQLAP